MVQAQTVRQGKDGVTRAMCVGDELGRWSQQQWGSTNMLSESVTGNPTPQTPLSPPVHTETSSPRKVSLLHNEPHLTFITLSLFLCLEMNGLPLGQNSKKEVIQLHTELKAKSEEHEREIIQLVMRGIMSGNQGVKNGNFHAGIILMTHNKHLAIIKC